MTSNCDVFLFMWLLGQLPHIHLLERINPTED